MLPTASYLGLFASCIPASYQPPPEPHLFQGTQTGASVFGTAPPTTGFGVQWWMMKQKSPDSLYGVKLHNLNTEIISLIGGSVFLRKVSHNTPSRYLGWETELGTGYIRGAMLVATRNEEIQLYAAPGLQLQVDTVLLTVPIGVSLMTKSNVSLTTELSNVMYIPDWLNGDFYHRIHPCFGLSYDW